MSALPVETRVRRIMADVFRCPEDRLTSGAKIKETKGWDSLAHVQLMVALEEAFGVRLETKEVMRLISLEAIVTHFQRVSGGD